MSAIKKSVPKKPEEIAKLPIHNPAPFDAWLPPVDGDTESRVSDNLMAHIAVHCYLMGKPRKMSTLSAVFFFCVAFYNKTQGALKQPRQPVRI